MDARRLSLRVAWLALAAVLAGCFDEPPDTSNLIFADAFPQGSGYQPFLNSKLDAATVDSTVSYSGRASLRFTVPTPGEPGAGAFNFSGGAIVSSLSRDLSGYTALTFWARASRDVSLNSLGLANDNTGSSRYQTEWKDVPLTTTWTRYVLPLPAPDKLKRERGLLWLSAGASGTPPTGYRVWFDDIQFEKLDTSGWNPRPRLTGGTRTMGPGETHRLEGTVVTYTVEGREVTQSVLPATFDFVSSNPGVATVDATGLVTTQGAGTATISASLAGVVAPQTLTVQVDSGNSPVAAPPAPTRPAANVLSLYSNAYPQHPINDGKMAADWSNGCSNPICPRWSEVTLGGDTLGKYTDLLFAGIEFTGPNAINATSAGLSHLHLDAWTRDAPFLKVKLVDFGADAAYGGGDDSAHELTFNASSSPALVTGEWFRLDIPLTSFTGLGSRNHLAQLVLSADGKTVFVDNIYFYK